MHVVRSATLRGYAALVSSLGGEPADLANRAGVPVHALTSDEVLVPEEAPARALELAAEQLGVWDFGLRLSDYQDLSGLGPLAVAIQNAATLGDALENARRFLGRHHQGSTIMMVPDPYRARGVEGLRYISTLEPSVYPQATDNALLNVHRVVGLLAGGQYGLRSVELGYRPTGPIGRYEIAFGGVRINTGQPATMLRLPSSVRDQPVIGAQELLREVAHFYLINQPAPDQTDIVIHVRATVAALMASGRLGLDNVAIQLELSTRTLQRRLAAEGTSLSNVIDDARRDTSERLLADPSLSMGDIAASLGLVGQAAFSRAARRWWGMTPSAKRRRLVASRGEDVPRR